MTGKLFAAVILLAALFFSFQPQAYAQNSTDELSPQTQQYIDNLNEVQQAQTADKPSVVQATTASSGPGLWTFVFYGLLSGATYAFWRWLKRLRNRD